MKYKYGFREGECGEWHENGQIKYLCHYKCGMEILTLTNKIFNY